MLSVRQLTVALGGRTVVSSVDLSLPGGRVTGLIGPNGAGKTALLRAVAGVIPARSGSIRLDGRNLADWPRWERARAVTYLAQDAPCSWPMTVRRIVALGRLSHLSPWQAAHPGGPAGYRWRPAAGRCAAPRRAQCSDVVRRRAGAGDAGSCTRCCAPLSSCRRAGSGSRSGASAAGDGAVAATGRGGHGRHRHAA